MTMLSCSSDQLKTLQEAQNGDELAWTELFQACYPMVRRVARRRLAHSMRSLLDSTDIASDVMTSLAANLTNLSFPSIDSLVAFLAKVAEQKVIDEYRRQHAAKRDRSKERPIYSSLDDEPFALPPSDEPRPSQFAEAGETFSRLLNREDPTEQKIIEMRNAGYTNSDIAEVTGWNIRKVQRFLKDAYDRLEQSGG
jgi:RNA polymerase sigma factor (sigma-70 family)